MIGILLAAGFSRRFGSTNKLLYPLPDGRPIALVSAMNLINVLPTSIAVLRPEQIELQKLLLNAGLNVVFCGDQDQEMADSLSTAIRFSNQFEASSDGFIIALADMPFIQPSTIRKVSNKIIEGASIVIPTFNDQRGHPIGFSAKFRNALENQRGDIGARSVIKHHLNEVELIMSDDEGILKDIDTVADLTTKL
jgi:molybdenum cofactor cytidylyltransferase